MERSDIALLRLVLLIIMKYDRFEKWMTRIKIPWWVFYENVNGCNYNDLRKMLLKAYKLGIKHSKENAPRLASADQETPNT